MTQERPQRVFPIIYSLEGAIESSHPVLHPDTTQYMRYWEEQEKYCIEGKWILDNDAQNLGGWRYLPGNLYFYCNFCIIKDEDDSGNTVAIIKPLLRDVEWMLSYAWLEARGFSGFEDDEEFTCNKMVKKLEEGGELNNKEKINLNKQGKYLFKPDGTYKTFVPAKDYLYTTKKKSLGKPVYGNSALNLFILGPRGWGKSYYAGNAVILHEYTFFGKKFADDSYYEDPAGVEIFVGAAIAEKSNELLSKMADSHSHLQKNFGSYGEYESFKPGFFYRNSKGGLGPNNGKSPFRHEWEDQLGAQYVKAGTGTSIKHGIYTKQNPQAAVGTRPTVMVIEEVGLVGNLLDVRAANETCQIRRNKFGSSFYCGTGGNMEKITESKIIFENPDTYNFLGFKDTFENRSRPIGFFLPAYYVDSDFKDELGNTDLEASWDQEMWERAKRKNQIHHLL